MSNSIKYEHPYDYITPDNFELIKTAIVLGINSNKSPGEIALLISQSTHMDQTVALALVQAELLDSIKELNKNGDKTTS